jgi:hypothetical protein
VEDAAALERAQQRRPRRQRQRRAPARRALLPAIYPSTCLCAHVSISMYRHKVISLDVYTHALRCAASGPKKTTGQQLGGDFMGGTATRGKRQRRLYVCTRRALYIHACISIEMHTYIRARTRRGRGERVRRVGLFWFRTLWTRACAPRSRGRPRARPASTRGGNYEGTHRGTPGGTHRGTHRTLTRVLTEILTRVLTGKFKRVLPGVLYGVLTGAYAGSRGVLPGCYAAEAEASSPYAVPRRTNRARNACTGSSQNT